MSSRRSDGVMRSSAAHATAALITDTYESDSGDGVDDHDGLELLRSNGKVGTKRRRIKTTGAREKKKRRVLLSDDDDDGMDDGDEDGPKISTTASAIRARASAVSLESMPMSRVARAEHATHLTYFDQLSAPAKSKNTLKDLPRLSQEQRKAIAAALPIRHPEEKARLIAYHVAQMREWYLQMRSGGYNMLAYGLGSKKKLLSEFARTWLTDGPVVVLNGYYPGANVKNLLNVFTRELMNQPTQTFRDVYAHVEFVRDWFRNDARMANGRRGRTISHHATDDSDTDEEQASSSASAAFLPRVYLLVHNIDGASLRTEQQQQVLAQLASIPQVHVVASVDHIMSGWLWDQSLLNQFNFVHHDCTTYAAYDMEFAFGVNSVADSTQLVDSSNQGRAGGIANVLTSLTPNHRKVLDVLAREQLQPNNPNFLAGTSFLTRASFFNACEENMLVANSASFDRLMTELRDHNLVEEKTVNKVRVVHIPYSSVIIRRHILGEEEDAAIAAAAMAAEEEQRREQERQEASQSAFAQALSGSNDADDGEEDADLAPADDE